MATIGRGNKDWKMITIFVMGILLVVTASWIGYTYYQAKQNNFALQNQQFGRLVEQRNILNSVETTGYYSLTVLDQENNQRALVLVPYSPQQTQQNQQLQQ
ncbi:hypothetical protein HYT56_04585 [Candidatus Woesearchaeota archaeon]|nr:hypothetical protein [Candidatus Woesearchaeota archaeon]